MTLRHKLRTFSTRARKGLGYLRRGEFRDFAGRVRALWQERHIDAPPVMVGETILPGTILRWCVMATPHTLFIAHLIARRLREHGWQVRVVTSAPDAFDDHFYVVICPQMFRRLPPPERRFVYQMEQSTSSRWFTKDYLDTLHHSRALLDYAMVNLGFLEARKIRFPYTYYLPVGADPHYGDDLPAQEKRYDILFYGDAASSPRRQALLAALEQVFSVHRCSEVFGDAMRAEIQRARVVINLHYYPESLLEMPRIQECLSLGVPVVSESAPDQDDYPEIADGVSFFPEGDTAAMIAAVRSALAQPVSAQALNAAAERGWQRFCFMFDRFLVGTKMLHPAQLLALDLPLTSAEPYRLVLSLPETYRRRRAYVDRPLADGVVFDGVHYAPGWMGCALSYSAMARHLLRHRAELPLIVEDDAELPADVEPRLATIRAYLKAYPDTWHVFAGLIADLHEDARVLKVEVFQGIRFVTIDRMTSTVCNYYSPEGLALLAAWDPTGGTAENNTIDRYLENHRGLRVIVALPFLASLRQELDSTLWGIGNQRYLELIAVAQESLGAKVQAFEASRAGVVSETLPAR